MAAPIKVLIDLNVVLDVLQRREPHYKAGPLPVLLPAELLSLINS